MKRLRVGLNGFGRIGRAVFRINHQRRLFDIAAINDVNPDVENLLYQLRYDTIYGRFVGETSHDHDSISVDGTRFSVYHEAAIDRVPWEREGVDVVIDSSGVKSNLPLLENLCPGIRHVILTNCPRDVLPFRTVIFGVNEQEVDRENDRVLSSSICDTIALSPIYHLIDRTYGVESGFLTTLHPWLAYQNLLDGPSVSWSQPGDIFSHYALGRASIGNLIPKSTSAVAAAGCVFPEIEKKVQSFSFRVPTSIVCSAVLVLMLHRDVEQQELVDLFKDFEARQRHPVIRNSVEPLTSIDYCGDEYSAVIDHRWTRVQEKRHVKLVYWYDNEWGYSNRVVDLVDWLGRRS